MTTHSDAAAYVLDALATGPKSARELFGVVSADVIVCLRAMAAEGVIALDPDRFPDEYVPGNPLIARLPEDTSPWPGWRRWNV